MNTLQDNLANISFIDKSLFQYVMVKGLYSESNIDAFYANHKKFIIGIPFTVGFVCDAIEELHDTSGHTITSALLLVTSFMLSQNQ